MLALMLPFSAHAAQLTDFDGQPRTLSEYTGNDKWVVVMLWHSTCRVSNAVVHEYADYYMIHSDNKSTVLGISLDGHDQKDSARGFIDKHGIEFPNLIGNYDDVVNMVENLTGEPWEGTPTFLIYSPAGELRAAQSGGIPAKYIEDYIKKNSN
jgi:peroxiredoxin